MRTEALPSLRMSRNCSRDALHADKGLQRNIERLRACLNGGEGPQVGEVTRPGGVTRLSI